MFSITPAIGGIRLYEGLPRFDFVYGTLNGTGSGAIVGLQAGTGSSFTNYACNAGGLSTGLQLSFQPACTDGGGTCPLGPVVLLQPSVSGTNFTFSFATLSGLTYTVQYKDGLSSSTWQTAQVYAGTGATIPFVTPLLTTGQRFYRLSVQ